MPVPKPTRARRRLARTFSRARWAEYERLLDAARDNGYRLVSLEDWIAEGRRGERDLVLRHDVDQHPGSALRMVAIEAAAGVRSTWYFRWRTAHADVIDGILAAGGSVGLHYETLSRRVLAEGLEREGVTEALIDGCRDELRGEIEAFARRYGPVRSICPHGDSRVPFINNAILVRGQDMARFGVTWDGNEAMRGRGLGLWMTDRSAAEGGWKDRSDPLDALSSGVAPILCLTHPNNWVSGPALWLDRLLGSREQRRAHDHDDPRRAWTFGDAPPRLG